jgi:hypothetical protein
MFRTRLPCHTDARLPFGLVDLRIWKAVDGLRWPLLALLPRSSQ